MNYWLVKTEPEEYSFDDLLRDKKATWDGIRNYQARNNLKAMQKGDLVLVYHSGKNKAVVGISEVVEESYLEPGDKTKTWFVIELKPVKKLKKEITLDEIKRDKSLEKMVLLKQSRLSVMPVTKNEFSLICR